MGDCKHNHHQEEDDRPWDRIYYYYYDKGVKPSNLASKISSIMKKNSRWQIGSQGHTRTNIPPKRTYQTAHHKIPYHYKENRLVMKA